MKSSFEQMGGTYRQEGDYLLPNIYVPAEKEHIGIWGQRHRRFLREHCSGIYTGMLLGGKLNRYLADIDAQAEYLFSQLVNQMKQAEGISEQLKADNQMAWVQQMNGVQNRVTEVVNREIIYRW
ncbi:MAG: TnpV protein [Clostridia bacterium]|nr:TnpV protein [Clostridia bacterium]NCC69424.1 TnpV protein [Clostridia bacterium]